MLCLGEEVHIGGALLRLGGPENSENLGLGSPRQRCLHLGKALRLGVHTYA